jgi:ABC-type antimicrobial peptide transport system permease subunit
MLRNYFKVAWRTIRNNKAFSFINIVGLALGMACSLLILMWVQDERSMDNFHTKGDRLYSVYERQYVDGQINAGYYTPGVLAVEMKRVIPEIEYASASNMLEKATFEVGDKIIKEEGGSADSDYFKMFSYPLLQGQLLTALNSPVSLAISDRMAQQFFGSAAAAIGKTIRFENRKDLRVTAVFANLPGNTSQKFEYLVNWPTFLESHEWAKNWGNNGPRTQLMLKANADPVAVKTKIKKFLDGYNKEQNASFRIELDMQPFADGYLYSNFKDGRIEGGRIVYVRLFSLVAIFILLIACINFMNLTTARSAKRAKEIGVRKVAGALRSGLMRQFLAEALFITSLSVIISLVLVILLLPLFSQVTGKQLALPFSNSHFWLSIVALTLVTGLLAGSYPALFLSSFKPIRVLKGALQSSRGDGFLRKGLVVFQFTLSIILIIGTVIVSKQVNYVQQINLGYDRENLLYIPLEGDLGKRFELFRQQALNTPGIKWISCVSDAPTDVENGTGGVEWDGKDPNTTPMFTYVAVGYDFVKTMGLKLAAGRDFSREFATDSAGYLVNEAALKIIHYKDPIGKPLTMWGNKGRIVGVLRDFHFTSLHDPIKPLIVRMESANNNYGSALVRTEPGKTSQALAGLEKIAKTINPQFTFTWSFSEEEYRRLYKSEQVVGRLSNVFAALAIFISCMGLLGLAMFTAEQRAREMSIRKVLGASAGSLFTLLSGEFILLVLLAFVIATPVAWLSMDKWLQDYAYQIPIEWWIFGLAGVAAVLIALATVSFQALKAALINPISSLRGE